MPVTWELAREDVNVWVGPIAVDVFDDDGNPVGDATVTLAVTYGRGRPVEADWLAPVANPDNPAEVGVTVGPVSVSGRWGVFVRAVRGDRVIVAEPSEVGWIERT